MPQIVNRILFIIIFVLLALLGYKNLTAPNIIVAPAMISNRPKSSAAPNDDNIQSTIQAYLVQNPQVIIDSIEQFQQRQAEESKTQVASYLENHQAEIEEAANSVVIGNDHADIVIIYFYDYNCHHCHKSYGDLEQLVAADQGIKIILKPLPILTSSSIYAAKVILAVQQIAPDKFAAIHQGLMQISLITKEAVEDLVIANQLDYPIIAEEIDKAEIQQAVDKNLQLVKNFKVRSVPIIIINGQLLPAADNLAQFQQIIAGIRASSAIKN